MKVQIWSDVMCPFCYIGKKNFEKALAQLPFADAIEVEWKSFQLDPTLQETSGTLTTKQYLMNKRGLSEAQLDQMMGGMLQMGKQAGIDFEKGNPIVANTMKAHQLLHVAKKHNVQNEMEELLFQSHFINSENVADETVLIALGNQLGIDSEEIRKAFSDEVIAYEVQQDILEARSIGVSGVPFFVLNNKYAVSGAQPSEVFVDALTQSYNEINPSQEVVQGNSCSIDGCE